MHGDTLSYAETFSEALAGLFDKQLVQSTKGDESVAELVTAARQAFRQYFELQGDGKFEDAAIQLRRLSNLLESLGIAAKH